jgi:hypothetical protein
MALEERVMLQLMFNVDSPPAYNWKIGLFQPGWTGNNASTLPTYELAGSRQDLGNMTWDSGTSSYRPSTDFYWGPLDAVSIAGWFIAMGTDNDTAYVGTFTTPVAVTAGDYLKLPTGYVGLGLL